MGPTLIKTAEDEPAYMEPAYMEEAEEQSAEEEAAEEEEETNPAKARHEWRADEIQTIKRVYHKEITRKAKLSKQNTMIYGGKHSKLYTIIQKYSWQKVHEKIHVMRRNYNHIH